MLLTAAETGREFWEVVEDEWEVIDDILEPSSYIDADVYDKVLDGQTWVAYCINLDRRPDRWSRICTLLAPHLWLASHLWRVPAVDGQHIDPEAVDGWLMRSGYVKTLPHTNLKMHLNWSHLPSGAMGCALSHRLVWEHLLELQQTCPAISWALVLEDDLLHMASDFKHLLANILCQLPNEWDVCYIGYHCDRTFRQILEGGSLEPSKKGTHEQNAHGSLVQVLPEAVKSEWNLTGDVQGTFGYLVSVAGARKLLEPGVVFPCQKQLDQQLGRAYSRRDDLVAPLSVWRVLEEEALVISPPFHCSDSDIQLPWGEWPILPARHEGQGGKLYKAISARLRCLDELTTRLASPLRDACCRKVPTQHYEKYFVEKSRRCVCYPICEPACIEEAKDVQVCLYQSIASLRRRNADIPVLVLWYSECAQQALEVRATVRCFGNCELVPMGAYGSAESLCLGSHNLAHFEPCNTEEEELAGAATCGLPTLVALHDLACLAIDQLLVMVHNVEVNDDIAMLFESNSSCDVHALKTSMEGGAVPKSAVELLSPALGKHEAQTSILLSPGVIYNSQSWLRMLPWLPEVVERLQGCTLPDGVGFHLADLAASCVFQNSGVSIGALQMSHLFTSISRDAAERVYDSGSVLDDPSDSEFHSDAEDWQSSAKFSPEMYNLMQMILQVPAPLLRSIDL